MAVVQKLIVRSISQSIVGFSGGVMFHPSFIAAMLSVLSNWAALQSVVYAVSRLRLANVLFKANHHLHLKLVLIASAIVIFGGSSILIGKIAVEWFEFWARNPFAIPLSLTLAVTLVVAITPLLVGGPMLVYIRRFPPDKWMSSRVARLSHPF